MARFSRPWFLAVHLPVPLVIGLRLVSGLGFQLVTFPVMVGAFFLGQVLGGWTRRWMMRAAEDPGPRSWRWPLRASSCGRGKQPAQETETRGAELIAASADPESLFTALEARLLDARTVDVRLRHHLGGVHPRRAVQGMLTLASREPGPHVSRRARSWRCRWTSRSSPTDRA